MKKNDRRGSWLPAILVAIETLARASAAVAALELVSARAYDPSAVSKSVAGSASSDGR